MKRRSAGSIHRFQAFCRDEEGATAVEYGLMAALIALAIIGIVTTLGKTLAGKFTSLNTQIH